MAFFSNIFKQSEVQNNSEEQAAIIEQFIIDEFFNINSKVDINEEIERIRATIAKDDMVNIKLLDRDEINREQFREIVKSKIDKRISREEIINNIVERVESEVLGYGILDTLINNRDISDIKVYSYNNIRIKINGKRKKADIEFSSNDEYIKYVKRIAVNNKVNISEQNAIQYFDDTITSSVAIMRIDITTELLTSTRMPILHIRTTPKIKWTREELIEKGFFDNEIADKVEELAQNAEGILFGGKGSSGKTTAMNYMMDFIPKDKSGYCIQEFGELHSEHPDIAFLKTVENKGEGKIQYSLQDLCKNGLISDIDYFIIGEIKGGEAKYLLNAVYTGAKGWASVHGASAEEAIYKLSDYIKYSTDYELEDILRMLVHLNTIIYMNEYKVHTIVQIVGFNREKCEFQYRYIVKDGKLVK